MATGEGATAAGHVLATPDGRSANCGWRYALARCRADAAQGSREGVKIDLAIAGVTTIDLGRDRHCGVAVGHNEGKTRVAIATALLVEQLAVRALALGKCRQPDIEILNIGERAIGELERLQAGLDGELRTQGLLLGQWQIVRWRDSEHYRRRLHRLGPAYCIVQQTFDRGPYRARCFGYVDDDARRGLLAAQESFLGMGSAGLRVIGSNSALAMGGEGEGECQR